MAKLKTGSEGRKEVVSEGAVYSFVLHDRQIIGAASADSENQLALESIVLQISDELSPTHISFVEITLGAAVVSLPHALFSPLETALRLAKGSPGKSIRRKHFSVRVVDLGEAFGHPAKAIEDPSPLAKRLKNAQSIEDAAAAFRSAFSQATAEIASQFNRWLASLEGERLNDATAEIRLATINRLAEAMGRDLIFEGRPVRLHARIRSNAKSPTIQVVTTDGGRQQHLWSRVTMPCLGSEQKR